MSQRIFKYLQKFHFNLNNKCNFRIQSYSKNIKDRTSKFPSSIRKSAQNIEEEEHKSTIAFHKFKKIMDVPDGIFKGMLDRFNGITIDSSIECNTVDDFSDKLAKSLKYWGENKYRGIWFKVYTENADWVPSLAKEGFNFHHAKNGYVMMYKWLPKNETENIPDYAHTMIGVGGLVVNEKNEVLSVSDRYALIPDSWKLPGGYVDPHENFVDAAIREVQEETGVESEFDTLISIRHSHGGGFGCSDIYIVIALKPKTDELKRCEREIAKVAWIPINQFLNDPNVHEGNRKFLNTYLMYKKYGIKINCEENLHQILKKKYILYSAELIKYKSKK